MSPNKLPRSFYSRSTLEVASDLLGKVLVRRLDRRVLTGKIVETEAYVGSHDLACHASKGHTPRTSVMFGPPGRAYVYMIYGFYFCLNVVTEPEDYPAAVLIRAVEPLENLDLMRRLRNNPGRDTQIASGPGKLCMAMSIDKQLNGANLLGATIWIEDRKIDPGPIRTSPRVGVDYAGEYKDKPWRFFVADNPHVSRVRFTK
ncbi:MAG: DNA-3-methyladenine glycosylase [Acidobacteria bacterium]|nr:DNA-3-methyladenine glycosylase [Acidobacteriota bacterium]